VAHALVIGRPLPRACEAYVVPVKWRWILGPRGHGRELMRTFRIGPSDARVLWRAIADEICAAPVVAVRPTPHGIASCRVDVALTIGERHALVRTVWHYETVTACPRLVTAFPTL
jgi:hypothetical protein